MISMNQDYSKDQSLDQAKSPVDRFNTREAHQSSLENGEG